MSENFQAMYASIVNGVFDETSDPHISELREQIMGKINRPVQRVFGDLTLDKLGAPTTTGTFTFSKGLSKGFNYKNLSSGEKAAFDMLLDFMMKIDTFNDTIICIDEPELHIHSRLQAKLLEELYRQLPEKCQLWLATHSVGMIRQAIEIYRHEPESVIFLDFDGHDFDQQVIIRPAKIDRQLWKKMFAVALDDIVELVAPSEIVFCEGRPNSVSGKRESSFDAKVFRKIFSQFYPETEFISLGGGLEVESKSILLEGVIHEMLPNLKIWQVIDRDDRTEERIQELQSQGIRVLRFRDLENYLWSDEILAKLCIETGHGNRINDVLNYKSQLIANLPTEGRPHDDIKYISKTLRSYIVKTLALVGKGNDTEEFSIVTLAPLITPDTMIYGMLKEDIFGEG